MLRYGVQLKFPVTNNEAEYEGILTGLRLKKALGAKNLLIQSDSKLVIRQIKEEYEANEERMQKYLKLIKHVAQEFDKLEFVWIPRGQNMAANEIAKMASSEERSTSMELNMEVQKPQHRRSPNICNLEHKQLDDTDRIFPSRRAPPSRCRGGQEDQEEGSQIYDSK